ncbi:hypothetical protein G7K_2001-t1 [Saitoella complicata NRRL Y-17804]|uniref:Uncharacterized protein n=1 Tax=Saitoella complicata (strain BCRC 22490 / CBS 7301 / JCM 7358 / NBRC 10748 / NRRL Y-17804) TaxID=698492 RepID=A0A0E9NDB7_SAICN|nr:hypothetical protein G7K_2001-t1 [Saitoella complicata NRRL Y-17804]
MSMIGNTRSIEEVYQILKAIAAGNSETANDRLDLQLSSIRVRIAVCKQHDRNGQLLKMLWIILCRVDYRLGRLSHAAREQHPCQGSLESSQTHKQGNSVYESAADTDKGKMKHSRIGGENAIINPVEKEKETLT